MSKKNKHDTIIELLVDRLVATGRYDFIFKNYEYDEKKAIGEVDVLAFDISKGKVRFYEVKSNHNDRAFSKALQQYYRFNRAHKNLDIKGIYVTPTKIKRL